MIKYILLLLVFLSSCKTISVKQEALQASNSYKEEVLNAQKIAPKNPNLAIKRLDQLLSTYPENNFSDDALFLMGNILEKNKRSAEAIRAYSRILDSKYASPLDGQTLLRKANLELKNRDDSGALKTLDYIQHNKLTGVSALEEIEKIRAPLLIKEKRYFDYLYSAKNIISQTQDKSVARAHYRQAQDVLKIKFSEAETKKVLKEPSLSMFHPHAALNLSSFYFENNQPEEAILNLEKHAKLLEDPVYKSRKDELLVRGYAYTSANIDVIGVILPLSGKYQFVGQQIIKGLQYSLNLWKSNNKVNFKLAILDSESDPNQVFLAFDELMKSDKPVAVIGGLVSKTAEVLLAKAHEYHIPSLIMSQKEGLTEDSKFGFQTSQPLQAYTDLIAGIAFDKMGFTKISVLHSKKSFSSRYAKSFAKSFTDRGGEILQTIEYDLSERRALPNAVKNLVGLLTIDGREDEYRSALRKWKRTRKGRGHTGTPKLEEILKPNVEFEALFVADGAKNGGLVASTLAYFDVEDVNLLGTHLWNDPNLLERGQRFVENAIFASSYFEPQILSSQCGQNFLEKFQEPINPYTFRGIEMGVILNSIYGYFNISSRGALLSALKKTSMITHKCLPQGLVRNHHNFSSPLLPLIVKDKSIVLMKPLTE